MTNHTYARTFVENRRANRLNKKSSVRPAPWRIDHIFFVYCLFCAIRYRQSGVRLGPPPRAVATHLSPPPCFSTTSTGLGFLLPRTRLQLTTCFVVFIFYFITCTLPPPTAGTPPSPPPKNITRSRGTDTRPCKPKHQRNKKAR